MKTSRTVSQIKEIDKTVYPKCNMKKDHQKQSLNLICLTKTCKFFGPICALCKKQHGGHNIVPIKSFVASISDAYKKLTVTNNKIEQQTLQLQEKPKKKAGIQKLQDSFKQIMGMLNFQVHQLSEQIRKTQDKMIQDFENAKSALEQQSSKGQVIRQSLQFLNAKQYTDGNDFRRNISRILKHVNFNKNEVKVQGKEEQIVKTYQDQIQIYKDNLIVIQTQIKQLYSAINEKTMKQKVEKVVFDNFRPKTAQVSILKPQNITFSPLLKASNITLQKQGKSAKLKDNNGNKIVFMQNAISSKIYQATVKIINLAGNICIGVGLKDKLKLKAYKFQKNIPNHGLYMIVSNTFKYNSSQKTEDGTSTSFAFGNDDEIHILLKVKQKKLIFSVKNDEKKKAELSLKSLPDVSFKQLQFCAGFTALGDKIQIV